MTTLLVEHLLAQGVERFCLSPGSRSTAIALAIAQNPLAECDVHSDERGLGFYALGRAKGSRKPVAVVVTSGTAVGNLMPAVMEACYDHVPLILVTADRPQELRDCSANQTGDQVKIFQPFVRWQGDLPLSEERFPASFLASCIAEAVFSSQHPRPGPVHINCMLRKPFFSSCSMPHEPVSPRSCESGVLVPSLQTIEEWAGRLQQCKKGLIVVGSLPHDTDTAPILRLAEALGWPIYADILSQLRTRSHSHLVSYFDPLVQAGWQQPIEAVLHLGTRTVSKTVSEWLKKQDLSFYLHIADYPTLMDPHYIVTHRLQVGSMRCASLLSDAICLDVDPHWLSFWKEGDKRAAEELSCFFSDTSEVSEPGIIRHIAEHIESGIGLFLANSMPIRDADKFFPPKNFSSPFFGNRGLSGIDGNIATAIGIAQGMRKPLIALIGDQAFLHDVNSLALLNKAEYPVCLIVINNGGGGLFSFLPVFEKKYAFERFFADAHPYSFAQAAALFHISYAQPKTPTEVGALLSHFAQNKRSILIECVTDRAENKRIHEEIAERIKNVVCAEGQCR